MGDGRRPRLRITTQLEEILTALLADPATSRYGFEIAQTTDLPVATVYPALRRLVDVGWLNDHMEEPELAEMDGRPRRRYYTLNQDGLEGARRALGEAAHRRERLARGISGLGAGPGRALPQGGGT